jgi:hypothetical protein
VKNVTALPHASATIRRETRIPDEDIRRAALEAMTEFTIKYGRDPDLSQTLFRGAVTTSNVFFELWEEE